MNMSRMTGKVFLLVLAFASTEAGMCHNRTPSKGHVWGYHGSTSVHPEKWADLYTTCAGSAQSPVDLADAALVEDPKLENDPFVLSQFNVVGANVSWTIANNGHTVKVAYNSGKPKVNGGGLSDVYIVEQFHFHWGSNNNVGSEHTVNGKSYPMELHIVTYNSRHGSFVNALNHSDGLAVLGVFFEISDTDNSDFDGIVKALRSVKQPGSSDEMKPVPLSSLMPANVTDFYRYAGSLTTPPCLEIVTWTVFKQPVPISARQMRKFRKLISSEKDANGSPLPMEDNFRPTQPLNGREINTVC